MTKVLNFGIVLALIVGNVLFFGITWNTYKHAEVCEPVIEYVDRIVTPQQVEWIEENAPLIDL